VELSAGGLGEFFELFGVHGPLFVMLL
jgi:hypothetical protein